MVRLYKYLLFAMALAGATLMTDYAYAQGTPTPSPTPRTEATRTFRSAATSAAITATVSTAQDSNAVDAALDTSANTITATATTTAAGEIVLLPTPTAMPASATITTASATTAESTDIEASQEEEIGPLQGTILANRSDSLARFFLEGETYQLTAGRSRGMQLPRATTVLNLFNCAGELATDTAGCFWDPYLVEQDGFYEIYNSSTDAAQIKLMLREAGAPPTGQVYVQNRTEQTESVVFKETVYEIEPTSVVEFPVATGVPAILYVRSCLTIDNQSACEWAPKTLDAGVYYAMIEVDVAGSQSGSLQTTIDLRPVVGEGETVEPPAAEVSARTPSIRCSVVVPALNVRSGPGLQYDIIGKVRTTDGSAVTVNVTGRSLDNEWLVVDPSVADGGWINNSPSFITCTGDVLTLPTIDAPDLPSQQAPVIVESPPTADAPIAQAPDASVEAPSVDQTDTESVPPTEEGTEGVTEEEPSTDDAQAIPEGQSLLVVNNGFQHEMRFTLDQQYRPQDGPSEFDLQPGQTLNIVVYPGDIPFTASTPWSALSGNASLYVEADQALPIWLRFEAEPDGSWVFRWE